MCSWFSPSSPSMSSRPCYHVCHGQRNGHMRNSFFTVCEALGRSFPRSSYIRFTVLRLRFYSGLSRRDTPRVQAGRNRFRRDLNSMILSRYIVKSYSRQNELVGFSQAPKGRKVTGRQDQYKAPTPTPAQRLSREQKLCSFVPCADSRRAWRHERFYLISSRATRTCR